MRRATRPFNKQALATADNAVYWLTKPPGRPLDPHSRADAELRKKWMDAYVAAGGAAETPDANADTTDGTKHCPNWIELRYLHCNSEPVKLAQYHIRSAVFSSDGKLDDAGFVRVDGVPDISGFSFWFDKDPEVYIPQGPSVAAGGEPGKTEAVSTLSEVGDWIWGTVEGDFNTDQSVSQIVVNTLLGLIPLVDQGLDIRDLIAGVTHLVQYYAEDDEEQLKHPTFLGLSYEVWLWIGVFLIAIGCIPELGSAVKGVFKTIIRFLQDAAKRIAHVTPAEIRRLWELLMHVLNHFGISHGNANRWLEHLPGKLDKILEEAGLKIRAALNSVREMIERAEAYARRYAGKKLPGIGEILSSEAAEQVFARARKYREAIAKAFERLEHMKRRVNEWMREQIEHVLGGKHPVEMHGEINVHSGGESGNVHIQEREPPSEPLAIERAAQREALRKELEEAAKKRAADLKLKMSNKQRGPVLSLVRDTKTGRTFEGLNHPGVPEKLHPVLEKRLEEFRARYPDGKYPHAISDPGTHSEIYALNDALWTRDPTGKMLTEKDLSDFAVYNETLWSNRTGSVPCCPNCTGLLEGVDSLSGKLTGGQ